MLTVKNDEGPPGNVKNANYHSLYPQPFVGALFDAYRECRFYVQGQLSLRHIHRLKVPPC